MSHPLRFVLFKGINGFGDRLQALLQVIAYAKFSKRQLVIDWRDEDWTHDRHQPIHTFFTLEGVPQFGLHEFTRYWQAHSHELTVHPASWAPRLLDQNYEEYIYKEIFMLSKDNSILDDICSCNVSDFDADIVVYGGVGKRSFRFSDLNNLRLSRWVCERIEASVQQHGLSTGSYDVVHLRGGSKRWAGGHVPLKSLDTEIHERWPSQDAYLLDLWEKYQLAIEGLPKESLLLISDQPAMTKAWQDLYQCGHSMQNTAGGLLRESGIHKLSPIDLGLIQGKNIKDELNIELLRDFVIMLHARKVIGDKISLFSHMAERCGAAGVRLMNFPGDAIANP
jgi:hypothetical protein